ncbi:hypothetical protein [Fusobacterium vincentii ATCC 49256]|uniref:Uncharacterized protein n=1 Tax=Fusobacterium vincentii ATCC 49256 TaxID=209882 RepID=Q7P775_FUSVC|nr:hypothetical protein [Fusobacterium vincentii ATCC 49256]
MFNIIGRRSNLIYKYHICFQRKFNMINLEYKFTILLFSFIRNFYFG